MVPGRAAHAESGAPFGTGLNPEIAPPFVTRRPDGHSRELSLRYFVQGLCGTGNQASVRFDSVLLLFSGAPVSAENPGDENRVQTHLRVRSSPTTQLRFNVLPTGFCIREALHTSFGIRSGHLLKAGSKHFLQERVAPFRFLFAQSRDTTNIQRPLVVPMSSSFGCTIFRAWFQRSSLILLRWFVWLAPWLLRVLVPQGSPRPQIRRRRRLERHLCQF